jgi:hypothetical protein
VQPLHFRHVQSGAGSCHSVQYSIIRRDLESFSTDVHLSMFSLCLHFRMLECISMWHQSAWHQRHHQHLRALALFVLAFVVSSSTLAAIVFLWIQFHQVWMGRASFAVLLIAVTHRASASYATLFIRFYRIVLLRLRVEFRIGQVIAPRSVLCVVRVICPAHLALAFGAIIAILSKIARRCPVCITLS